MNAVTKMEAQAPAANSLAVMTPMDMLNRAVSSGAGIEVLEKLMVLQERWEANQARKAFDEAVANAKAEMPVIIKNATGHNSKKYADFAAIANAIDPIISKHGLSYRFRTTQADKIAVTCILSHKSGHSEETTLCGPADTTGNKNAIQAIGSTLTYLQRYSLVQALGLAASADDDGHAAANGGEGSRISEEQADEINLLIAEIGGDHANGLRKGFLKLMKVESVQDIPASRVKEARTALEAKRGTL